MTNQIHLTFQYYFEQRDVERFINLNSVGDCWGFQGAEFPLKATLNKNNFKVKSFVLCKRNEKGYGFVYLTTLN